MKEIWKIMLIVLMMFETYVSYDEIKNLTVKNVSDILRGAER